jgi:GNAT superfamily N-acetyltransferase
MDAKIDPATGDEGPCPVAHGSGDYRACVELRDAVLRRPLGMSLSPEQLAGEAGDLHLAYRRGGVVVACVVLTPLDEGRVRLRQMAVAPAHRRRGIGTRLLAFAEGVARDRGFRECLLHAREEAVDFYARQGYRAVGPAFEEVTLPHRLMCKPLAGPNEPLVQVPLFRYLVSPR